MAAPLALRLTRRVRQLLPTIESGVAAGLSSRAINAAITRATGTGIRRQTLLDIMRSIRQIETVGESLQFVRFDRVPNPDRTPLALTRIRRRFGSTVRLQGRLVTTGESVTMHVQVTHDEPLTRGEIELAALGFVDDDPEGYGLDIDRALLVRQVRRAA